MLFRMTRTQTGAAGTYRAGVAYDATGNPAAITEGKTFIEAGFAEEVSAAQLRKEKETAEALATKAAGPANDKAALKAARKEVMDAQSALAEAEAKIAALEAELAEMKAAATSKPDA